METEISKLHEEAIKRRERLKNLKRSSLPSESEAISENNSNQKEEELPKPIFRSYTPQDDSLKENLLPKTKPETVETQIKSHLEAAKPEPLIDEVDLSTLAPRKPDWDLKRDVAKKLEKLERRTQRAIAELIRERLKSSEENLAEIVNTFSESNNQKEDSDDD